MTHRIIAGITTLTIVLSAGTAFAQVRSAPADQRQPQRDRTIQQGTERTAQIELRLHKTDDLIGSDLHNRNGDKIGSIEDFIVERGSGKLVFAIVEIGGVLGMGGHEFALPYERLTWSDSDNRFTTDMTKEQAEAQGEFLPDNWNDLHNTSWMQRVTGWGGNDRNDDLATERAIMAATGRAEAEEIRGRITDVRREDERTGSDMVIVDIETQNGQTREVILGPSWYVTGHDAAPLRGQTVVIKARKHDGRYYGWSAGERGTEMMLRNEQGRSAWSQDRDTDRTNTPATNPKSPTPNNPDRSDPDRTSPDRNQPANQPATRPGTTQPTDARTRPADRITRDRSDRTSDSSMASRYILLSDLIGTNADARGISSGEIEGALIEGRSGKIAFLLFDPNENFLGIGDTISLVPWSVAYINRDMKVNFDADASAFSNAMEMPKDLTTLRSSAAIEPAYRAFQVRPAQFRERSANPQNTQREGQREGWDGRQDRNNPDRPGTDRPTNDRPANERPSNPTRQP